MTACQIEQVFQKDENLTKNTPKYGLLFHSTHIGRASTKNRGHISRYLANKCSMASRIDVFSETPASR